MNHFITVNLLLRLHKTSKELMNWVVDKLGEFIIGYSELKRKPWEKWFMSSTIILCLKMTKNAKYECVKTHQRHGSHKNVVGGLFLDFIAHSYHIRKKNKLLCTEFVSVSGLCGWRRPSRQSCLHPAASQYSQMFVLSQANVIGKKNQKDKPGWIIHALPLWAYPFISKLRPPLHVSEWEWSLWQPLYCWQPHKYRGACIEVSSQRRKGHLCNSFISEIRISVWYVSFS